MMQYETAKKLVRFIATRMERESALLYPEEMRNAYMNDPYGLLKLIQDEAGISSALIDAWMVEAQKAQRGDPT